MVIFREETKSALARFHSEPLARYNWNLEMLVFVEGDKPKNSRESLGARREPTANTTIACSHAPRFFFFFLFFFNRLLAITCL